MRKPFAAALAAAAVLAAVAAPAAAFWVRAPVATGRFIVTKVTGPIDLTCVLNGLEIPLAGHTYDVVWRPESGPAEQTSVIAAAELRPGDRFTLAGPAWTCGGMYLFDAQLEDDR